MNIYLSTPIDVGALNPNALYPNVNISSFAVNNSSSSMTVTYEIGTYTALAVNATLSLTSPSTASIAANTWTRAPEIPPRVLTISGSAMVPFYLQLPTGILSPLWDQIQTVIYKVIQQNDTRLAGTIS